MKVTLHIGHSKTGTTAIQKTLAANRANLLAAGILYPPLVVNGIELESISHNAVADSLTGGVMYPRLTPEQYFSSFFEMARKYNVEHIILSGEHFFGGGPRLWDGIGEEEYLEKYRQKIRTLAKFLNDCEVHAILYLRPQIEWLESATAHFIKWEGLVSHERIYKGDDGFVELLKPSLLYGRLLDIWCDELAPSRLTVTPYIKENLLQGDTVQDFVSRAGLGHVDCKFQRHERPVNESLSMEYVKVKDILNNSPHGKSVERVRVECLEALAAKTTEYIRYRFSGSLRREIEDFVAEDNRYLSDKYMHEDRHLLALMHRGANGRLVSDSEIEAAVAQFEKEYARPKYRISWLVHASKALLREHARPVHMFLHKVKRVFEQ